MFRDAQLGNKTIRKSKEVIAIMSGQCFLAERRGRDGMGQREVLRVDTQFLFLNLDRVIRVFTL